MACSLTLPTQLRELEAETDHKIPVTIFSRRLGASIVLLAEGTGEEEIGGHPFYTPVEALVLRGVSDRMLAAIHNPKTVMGRWVVNVHDSRKETQRDCRGRDQHGKECR